MAENKRYVDNGYEAIEDQSFTDTETDKTYWVDYFDEIVDLVNEQDKVIKELEQDLNDALNRIEERSMDVQLLKKENENQNNILEDFMVMLNRLQANPDDEILQSMAKDMLRMMGKDIMGDAND